MWMDANGLGFGTLLSVGNELSQFSSMMGELGSTRTSLTWVFEGNCAKYLPVIVRGMIPSTGEPILEGTFVIDTANKRFTVTDGFGDKYTFQYIVDTINTSQQDRRLKRLQLKDRGGKVTTFYSYLDEEKTSSAPAAPANPGMGTTRDPEFQREWEKAYNRAPPVIPPGLVLPGGQTVEERARSGTNNPGGYGK